MPPLVRREEVKASGAWKAGKFLVDIESGKVPRPGFQHGELCVHRVLPDDRSDQEGAQWAVTHVPTGLLICWTEKEDQARLIGEELWGRQCMAFRLQTSREVTEKLAGWVVPWVRECRRQRKYVSPELFLKEEVRKR